MLENHCTQPVQSQSTRAQNSVPVILMSILYFKIIFAEDCHLYIQLCILCELTAPKKGCFPEKGIKGILVIPTLDKMHHMQKIGNFENCSGLSYCTHSTVYWVFWSSDRVVDCLHIDYI